MGRSRLVESEKGRDDQGLFIKACSSVFSNGALAGASAAETIDEKLMNALDAKKEPVSGNCRPP